MFTGIIEETGTLANVRSIAGGREFVISCSRILGDLKTDHSVAVNGVCLTAVSVEQSHFTAAAVEETLKRTTLGTLKKGESLNLERAMQLGDRLGGHFVQGHVDGRGRVLSIIKRGAETRLVIEPPQSAAPYLIEKGSVTVNGISLTIAVLHSRKFEAAVIPHTWKNTNLASLRPGSAVNIEADMISKYIEKMVQTNKGVIHT